MSIFSICNHTIQESFDLLSQNIENQQITSLKCTVIARRLRQNDSKRANRNVGHWNQCKRVASLFCCSRVVDYSLVRRYK